MCSLLCGLRELQVWSKTTSMLLAPTLSVRHGPVKEGVGLRCCLLVTMERVICLGQFSPANIWLIFMKCLFLYWCLGTLGNCTRGVSFSLKTNFTEISADLTTCFRLAPNLTPKLMSTPAFKTYSLCTTRHSYKTSHTLHSPYSVQASQIICRAVSIPHLPSTSKAQCFRKGLASHK